MRGELSAPVSCGCRIGGGSCGYLRGGRDTSSSNDAAELKAGLLDPFQRALDGFGDGVSLEDVRLEELCGFGIFGDEGGRELLVHVKDSDVAAGLDEVDDAGAAET